LPGLGIHVFVAVGGGSGSVIAYGGNVRNGLKNHSIGRTLHGEAIGAYFALGNPGKQDAIRLGGCIEGEQSQGQFPIAKGTGTVTVVTPPAELSTGLERNKKKANQENAGQK
jgi:hypothetical protein